MTRMEDEESQFRPSRSSKLRNGSDEEKPRFKVALGKERTNIKCLLYIFFGILVVCYVMFVALFVVLHVKTPEVKLRFVKVKNLKYSFSPPSFNTTLSAQMTVKNPNFGCFEFEPSTVSFLYDGRIGSRVGGFRIRDGKAKILKMKRLSFGIDVRSNRLPEGPNTLISDLNSGMLNLSGSGRVRGRVKLWKIINKSKISNMDCNMMLDLKTKTIKDLACR